MWLEAIFTRDDLRDVAERFSPLQIILGATGSLLLTRPRDVSLIADEGASVTCDATIHWPVLGLDLPVSLRGLRVNVLLSIEPRRAGSTLVFRLRIDHAGVAILPAFFDHTVTARINEELQKKHAELAWNFTDTLTHAFALPAFIASSEALLLQATAGRVKVTEAALGLAVDFAAFTSPRAATLDVSNGVRTPVVRTAEGASHDRPSTSVSRLAIGMRWLALGAVAGGLLLAAVRVIEGIGRKRVRS